MKVWSQNSVTMLSITIFLFFIPTIVLSNSNPVTLNFQKLILPNNSFGPESFAFDKFGRGPYTSISDGRIVRYDYYTNSFHDFAFTAPNRSKAVCEGTSNTTNLGPICGRPLGIEFYVKKNQLFIADAYRGLVVVGANGGLATQLATSADDGVPFKCLNGLSVDQSTGDIYFTDFSSTFPLSQIVQAIISNDTTGRFLKYDYKTGQVTTLLTALAGANGVAISSNCNYILVAETIKQRILKYWLKGPKAFTFRVVAKFGGRPDNIRRTSSGHFWVALNFNPLGVQVTNPVPSRAVKIDGNGRVLQDFSVGPYYNTTIISEFKQRGFEYFVGSVQTNYVGVLYQS